MEEPTSTSFCGNCLKPFTPNAAHQRYCSTNCRVLAWQRRAHGAGIIASTDEPLFAKAGLLWVYDTLMAPGPRFERDEPRRKHPNLTWETLTKQEPKLLRLYHLAAATYDDPARDHFCANWIWVRFYKPIVGSLVGWSAVSPPSPYFLTSAAYDIAYNKIYDQLPGCRNCMCM